MEKGYWQICVEEILGNHGVDATSEQIAAIAEDIKSCAGVQGDYLAPTDRGISEAHELRAELKTERSKEFCVKCQGTGQLTETVGTSHSSISQCWICKGAGRK